MHLLKWENNAEEGRGINIISDDDVTDTSLPCELSGDPCLSV